ncbi:MAG: methyltransferase domain-containing protein [Caldimonas sp.]
MLARILEPETLDHLAPDDPAAVRSRHDLRRVNRFMGARAILGRAIDRALPMARIGAAGKGAAGPLRIVELGCGDGLLMLDVARSRGRPAALRNVELTLLDLQPIVAPTTLAAYAAAGWRAETLTADVLAWAADTASPTRWDIVVANLFLHHFEGEALGRLLAGCARRAEALAATEPRRSRFALAASHLVVCLGANAVTRRDAVLSVRAGFVGSELSGAWPASANGWRLEEYEDGPFTHCFCAARQGGAR